MVVKGSKGGSGGMLQNLRRFGRKNLDETGGHSGAGTGGTPAFSSASAEGESSSRYLQGACCVKEAALGTTGGLTSREELVLMRNRPGFWRCAQEAPPGSRCTSLIGGQRHELPLIVFTVVEEISRRGKRMHLLQR